MKRNNLRKTFAILVLSLFALSLFTVCAFAEGETVAPIEGGRRFSRIPAPKSPPCLREFSPVVTLPFWARRSPWALPCLGSAKGVGIVGEASSGLLSEDPSLFGKALALQALPMTQGVYGMVASFLMLNTIGLFGTPKELTVAQGAYFIMAALPIALAGYLSAIKQARVSAAGISLLSKRPGELGKAITSAALVETYAIFSLLITLLMVANFPA